MAALILFWLATILTPATSPAQTTAASVSGRVVDAITGQPVTRARVELRRHSDGRMLQAVPTDDDGAFRIRGLSPIAVQLVATRDGYLEGAAGRLRPRGDHSAVVLTPGAEHAGITIRMWPTASIHGRVTDEAGRPLERARVELIEADEDVTRLPARRPSATSEDDGRYEITGLPPGRYSAVVTLTYLSLPVFPWPRGAVGLLSEDGNFRMSSATLPPDRTSMYVATWHGSATRRDQATPVELQAADRRPDVDIQVATAPRQRVRGTVTGPDGRASNAVIVLRGAAAPFMQVLARSDFDGRFELMAVPPGEYVLEATRQLGSLDVILPDPAGLWAEAPLVVGDGDVEDVAIELKPGFTVQARLVTIESDRLDRRAVRLAPVLSTESLGRSSAGGEQEVRDTTLVATGIRPARYRFATDGRWTVVSVTRRGRDLTGQHFTIDEDARDFVVELTRRPATLTGTVTTAGGGVAADASVVILPADPGRRVVDRHFPGTRTARVDTTGAFELAGLPPGEYLVVAVDERRLDRWPDPALLDELAAMTERVTLGAGELRSIPLRIRP